MTELLSLREDEAPSSLCCDCNSNNPLLESDNTYLEIGSFICVLIALHD